MAKKISDLTSAAEGLGGDEYVEIVQGGDSLKTTVDNLNLIQLGPSSKLTDLKFKFEYNPGFYMNGTLFKAFPMVDGAGEPIDPPSYSFGVSPEFLAFFDIDAPVNFGQLTASNYKIGFGLTVCSWVNQGSGTQQTGGYPLEQYNTNGGIYLLQASGTNPCIVTFDPTAETGQIRGDRPNTNSVMCIHYFKIGVANSNPQPLIIDLIGTNWGDGINNRITFNGEGSLVFIPIWTQWGSTTGVILINNQGGVLSVTP